MKSAKLISLVLLSLCVVGCSRKSISIGLASDSERIPSPIFMAKDVGKTGQTPSYSRIRVFDVTDKCEVPQCPVVWHVVVSTSTSPNKIAYGGLPSMGATTIVGAKELGSERTYTLILDQEEDSPQPEYGRVTFSVDENNIVYLVPQK